MRVPNSLYRGEVDFNMTPMIDVVFLLIIFFLVSSHLAKQESQMPLPLPQAISGSQAVNDEKPRVVVNVRGDGQIILAGRQIPVEQLQQRLQNELSHSNQDLEIRIRGDRNVPYQFVEPILLAAARSGIWNVKIAVYRPEDVPQ